jgi:hypothetical protein
MFDENTRKEKLSDDRPRSVPVYKFDHKKLKVIYFYYFYYYIYISSHEFYEFFSLFPSFLFLILYSHSPRRHGEGQRLCL